MTRILLVTKRFYPPWSDGTVSYARGLVDSILEVGSSGKNLEISVLSLTDEIWFPKYQQVEMKEYLEKRNVNMKWFQASEGWQQTNLLKLFRKISKDENYDLVHLIFSGLNPLWVSIVNKNKSVIAKHLIVFPFHSNFAVDKHVYNFFDKTGVFRERGINLVFSSEVLQRMYDSHGATILPPAVDTGFYKSQFESPDIGQILMSAPTKIGDPYRVLQRDVIALYMGPLLPERFDYRNIIGGFAKLRKEYGVDAGFLIVGRGFEQSSFLDEIKRYVEANALSDHVFLALKPLKELEKKWLLNRSHIFVYPTSERLPNMTVVFPPIAILEAMSAGLCVVSGGLPFLDTIIKNNENGVLISSKTSQRTVAEGMWLAIINKKKFSQNATLMIEQNFSIRRVSELYRSFLSQAGL